MSFLTPLGFLGFLGVVALIIIYIIKPNFQNKIISSTFIWKLSLKYKKKRIPISKLRNIILFICQVLILSAAAFGCSGFSCSVAIGIFQGSNLCPLYWQADSYPLC